MIPFNRKKTIRLVLLAASLSVIAAAAQISQAVARGEADSVGGPERLNAAIIGKPVSEDQGTPEAYQLPGSSFQPPEVSILEAQDVRGQTVSVRGVVVTEPVVWQARGGKLSLHIEDDTGGMHILVSPRSAIQKGDAVRITGTVSEYEGLIEIRPEPEQIRADSGGQAPEPEALHAEALLAAHKTMPYMGKRVKVKAQMGQVPEQPRAGAYHIPIAAGENAALTLYIREDMVDLSHVEEKGWYEITGILSQYNGYRIMPASGGDIRPL
ncbi:Endonuclease YhcR [Paenibacillus solanacearum]|uniref:Endonuclease YhcR n=1 Tax=Paenibacillus solanacearum TaxID=2048548 RepID=A0A916K3K8_9BACL|nr:hypothetical protein [Paenibacillus solanacearum]CAG7637339.1 Endonuclease YhcR [Paenibacillus solanacearum]